ncbi:hypothetical protein HDU98_001091 [Podochytrium sp. JEL0797]|nr:hypothetical protein HDU98_001091 [Podochytrium sp. JEL0797]
MTGKHLRAPHNTPNSPQFLGHAQGRIKSTKGHSPSELSSGLASFFARQVEATVRSVSQTLDDSVQHAENQVRELVRIDQEELCVFLRIHSLVLTSSSSLPAIHNAKRKLDETCKESDNVGKRFRADLDKCEKSLAELYKKLAKNSYSLGKNQSDFEGSLCSDEHETRQAEVLNQMKLKKNEFVAIRDKLSKRNEEQEIQAFMKSFR